MLLHKRRLVCTWCDNWIPGIVAACRCSVDSGKLVYSSTFGHVQTCVYMSHRPNELFVRMYLCNSNSNTVISMVLVFMLCNFHLLNPSGYTMALGSTQALTAMGTRNISCGGGGKATGA